MARVVDTPWRRQMSRATFRGVEFHVEMSETSGARRVVLHEFPKRDLPYAEDMGRRARRFTVSAYLISPNWIAQRNALTLACDQEGPGTLKLPFEPEMQVNCDHSIVVNRRTRGGMCEIEMTFTEAGKLPTSRFVEDTQGNVQQTAQNATTTTQSKLDDGLSSPQSQGLGGLGPSLA